MPHIIVERLQIVFLSSLYDHFNFLDSLLKADIFELFHGIEMSLKLHPKIYVL
jgi:hypothetical protein